MRQVTISPGFPSVNPEPLSTDSEHPIMRVTLFLFSPISGVKGSSALWFSQALTEASVPLAGLWVILIDLIIQIVAWLTRKGLIPSPGNPGIEGPPGSVTMTLPDLAEFLKQLRQGSFVLPEQNTAQDSSVSGPRAGWPAWFTVYILVSGWALPGMGRPNFSLFLPIFTIEGITGGLPILIIGLIATILIRSVVPPASSGIQPLEDSRPEPVFQLKWQELLNLLKGYGKFFK